MTAAAKKDPNRKSKLSDDVRIVHKRIRLREQFEDRAAQIAVQFNLTAVPSRVLAARGFSADSALSVFLAPTLKDGLPEPSKLVGVAGAVKIVAEALAKRVGIAICCDFDVDGLTGGAQIHDALTRLGAKNNVYVPDRFTEGYGLSTVMIDKAFADGHRILLCVDYGTTNAKELAYAKGLGFTTIVIDHHHVGDHKPNADAFINPQQDSCGFASGILSASGLAWYFISALRKSVPGGEGLDPREYLDLASLGTICDMVPLLGPNRVLAKKGLELLSASPRLGIKALKDVGGISKTVSCYDVSFALGPRINAAGRMVHGETVIELLTTRNPDRARTLAHQLNKLNVERQETEQSVKAHAVDLLEQRGSLASGIVVWHDEFHTGVIGIVAQRLVESFYRPAVVFGIDQEGRYKGSVRGIKGFNVVQALSAVAKHTIKFGGHEGAGGLLIERSKIEDFKEAWENECTIRLAKIESEPTAEADTVATLGDISSSLVQELKSFSPFGVGNGQPQLLLRNVKVRDVRVLKGMHLKVVLTDGNHFMTGLMWRTPSHPALITGTFVNVVAKPDISTFNGMPELQLNLQAVEAVK